MDAEAEFDWRLLFEQIREDAKETYKQNPFDVDRWSGALLELAQFHNMSDSKQMIQDAITKLEEALLSDPKKHDALWCVRNAYTSFAFLTPEETEAKYKFDLSTQFFQQVVEEQRENPLYLKSLELTAKESYHIFDICKLMESHCHIPFGGDMPSMDSEALTKLPTNPHWRFGKTIDMLMLNQLKESYCDIRKGDLETVATVHSHEDSVEVVPHNTNLISVNVPPMGMFYPNLLVLKCFPSHHMHGGGNIWDNFAVSPSKPMKEEKISHDEAIMSIILSAGRIDLRRKLFSNIQLIGGVGLTKGLVSIVRERVLHAIPPTKAIDTLEVLKSRTKPTFVTWKGGVVHTYILF